VHATAINPDFYFGIPLASRPEIAELLDRKAKCAIAGQAMTLRGDYLARMQEDSFLLCLTTAELTAEGRAYLALLLKDDPVAACIVLFMNRDEASALACLMLPPWAFYALLTAALQEDFDETLLDGNFAGLLAQVTVDQAALAEDPLRLIGYWPILQLARELKKGGRSCAESKQATARALAALQLELFQKTCQTAAPTRFAAAVKKVEDALADRD
ncbi:MAG TPA: hypothetical protein PLP17_07675, partial [Oligoflexia bacterium]|nr:hypothetical protein [Oligoflexia bacterium]